MPTVSTTLHLVASRMRFDWKRHAVALVAIAVLMASFLTFNALAAGLHDGLRQTLIDREHDRIQFSLGGFSATSTLDEDAFRELASAPGVVASSARSAQSIGLVVEGFSGGPGGAFGGQRGNVTTEILLVGLDAAAEEDLVVEGTGTGTGGFGFTRGGHQARNYTLLAGTWIQGPGDAVATANAAQAGFTIGVQLPTPVGMYTVVGVVSNHHPAALTVPGVIPAGNLLVDRSTHEWPRIGGAYFQLEPDYPLIRSFADRLAAAYPTATGNLQSDMMELERQHFEEARTQQVLAAAGRLVGLAGVATVFAMSLFLLIGERKAMGTLAAVGFTPTRLASYMIQKMLLMAVLGTLAGGALGWLTVALFPKPILSFPFVATVDAATFGLAGAQTLAAALAGSFLALVLTIRQDPIQALHTTE